MKNLKIEEIKISKDESIGHSRVFATIYPELKEMTKGEIITFIIINHYHKYQGLEFTLNTVSEAFQINYNTLSASLSSLEKKGIISIIDDTIIYNHSFLFKKNVEKFRKIDARMNNTKVYFQDENYKLLKDQIEKDLKSIQDKKELIELRKLQNIEFDNLTNEIEELEKSIEINNNKVSIYEDGSAAITNNTKEIVEETQKEAVLNDKNEIEHINTSSIIQPLKQAKTEQKEIIKEDTSNNTEVDNNKEYENRLKMKEDDTIKLLRELFELDKSNLSAKEKEENLRFKMNAWITSNRKDYSDKYYLQVALNNYLQSEIDNIIENNKIYNSLPEATEEEKSEINGEYEIENAVDKYAKALEMLHSKYVSDKVSKEYITKEFDEFFIYMDKTQANIIEVYRNLKHKFEKDMVKDVSTQAPEEQKEVVLDVVKEIQVKDTPVAPEAEKTVLNGVEKYKNLFEAARMEALKTEENNKEVTSSFDNII